MSPYFPQNKSLYDPSPPPLQLHSCHCVHPHCLCTYTLARLTSHPMSRVKKSQGLLQPQNLHTCSFFSLKYSPSYPHWAASTHPTDFNLDAPSSGEMTLCPQAKLIHVLCFTSIFPPYCKFFKSEDSIHLAHHNILKELKMFLIKIS